ncbi:hypothetical protein FHG87_020008 [Trinorchestia longiramus]|nr:hypothetical protein FHG87_020008 [Trinorchestia longiramus]
MFPHGLSFQSPEIQFEDYHRLPTGESAMMIEEAASLCSLMMGCIALVALYFFTSPWVVGRTTDLQRALMVRLLRERVAELWQENQAVEANQLLPTDRSVSPSSTLSVETGSAGGGGAVGGGSSRANSIARPSSPSPSALSDKTLTQEDPAEKQEREEIERKQRLQLYVFVMRTIAYPFNAKQPTDLAKRPIKVTKQQLETIQGRFQSFLKGELQIAADEAFTNAVQSYHDIFLKSERVSALVASGACSQYDLREVFRNNVRKRVRSLPEIDGLSKETVITSWMAKFDCIIKGEEDTKRPNRIPALNSEQIMPKEQLFDVFQQILGVKKFEHQLLYNALQVLLCSYL